MNSHRLVLTAVAVLGMTHHAMAQCPVANNGDPNVSARLDRCEAQIAQLNTRIDRVERLTASLAESSANLYQTVARRSPEPDYRPDYRLVSLRDDPPAAPPPQAATAESGRVEIRCFGVASVRIPLPGTGGMLAVGAETAAPRGSTAVTADDGYYRQPAQRIPLRQASYRRSTDYNPFAQ
jgi:hypothetical protein